jgi:hypothetical protein
MQRFVLLAFAFLALAFSAPAAAGPVTPTKPSQIVSAIGRPSSPLCPGVDPKIEARLVNQRGENNGSVSTFAIPPKSVFVVQSVDFQIIDGNANVFEGVNLLAVDPAVPPTLTSNGAALFAGGQTDANGTVVGNVVVPSGLVIEPPAALCFQVREGVIALIAVHGFFAKDK